MGLIATGEENFYKLSMQFMQIKNIKIQYIKKYKKIVDICSNIMYNTFKVNKVKSMRTISKELRDCPFLL